MTMHSTFKCHPGRLNSRRALLYPITIAEIPFDHDILSRPQIRRLLAQMPTAESFPTQSLSTSGVTLRTTRLLQELQTTAILDNAIQSSKRFLPQEHQMRWEQNHNSGEA